MASIVRHFEQTALKDMRLSTQVVVPAQTTVREAVLSMAEANTSCAFVMSGRNIAGIFTEHDVTHRVVRSPDMWDQPVEKFMRANPGVIDKHESAMTGLRLMSQRRMRNIPVLLDDGDLANLTHYDLIALASDYLGAEPGESDEFSAEHTLRYIDFYGMPSRVPMEVETQHSLSDTIELMVANDRGLISVVDERGVLLGEFTQHDVFRKVACRVEDLEDEVVGDWMTTENIASALPSAKIADGLREMAAKRHRYLILVNETGRSVGTVTFRDIADFFEAAFV